jgi:small subunit ribosomal protein S8
MNSTDPVADMLTRIRNAIRVNRTSVTLPFSRLKLDLAQELAKHGFVGEVTQNGEGIARQIEIRLRSEDEPNRISVIERVSKPGRRLYAKAGAIPRVMNGRGIMIVSTSHGLMSDNEARKAKVGGELICKVY